MKEEKIWAYLNRTWGFNYSDSDCDIQAAYDEGCLELVCHFLISAGAVENNCKEAAEIIKIAESLSRTKVIKLIKETFKDYFIVECSSCNHVGFYKEKPEINATTRCYGCACSGHLTKRKR